MSVTGNEMRRRRRGGGRRALRALAPVLLALTGVACGMFSPRAPEEPEGSQPIFILSDPDSVYQQLQVGVSSKFITTYMNSFDPDEYTFVADQDDRESLIADLGTDPFVDWSFQIEEQVHTLIFSSKGRLELTFGPGEDSVATDQEITILKPYTLVADDETFEGKADWTMKKKGGQWRITRWEDRRITRSWSYLKGLNR